MSNSEIDSLSESTNSFMPGGSCFDDIFYDHPYVVSMCASRSTMEKWQLYMQKAQENIDNKVYLKKKSFILKKEKTFYIKEKKIKKRFHVCSICAYINISESDMSCNTVPV